MTKFELARNVIDGDGNERIRRSNAGIEIDLMPEENGIACRSGLETDQLKMRGWPSARRAGRRRRSGQKTGGRRAQAADRVLKCPGGTMLESGKRQMKFRKQRDLGLGGCQGRWRGLDETSLLVVGRWFVVP